LFIISQVCGLKWSPDHQHLASGGNDNKLFVWNTRSVGPVQTYAEHLAAVKAIAWSPHQHGLLASGGGTADRRIRFWNTITGRPLQCVDTGSQVCNLAWSKHSSELVGLTVHVMSFSVVFYACVYDVVVCWLCIRATASTVRVHLTTSAYDSLTYVRLVNYQTLTNLFDVSDA